MKQTFFNRIKILQLFIVCLALFFAGSVSVILSPKPQIKGVSVQKPQRIVTQTYIPTTIPLPTSTPTKRIIVIVSATPTPPSIQPTSSYTTDIPTPSLAPIAAATPSPTSVAQTVSLEIQTPNGTSQFTIKHIPDSNVCDILQIAKDEEKIESLTLDDSYMASLHSKYVYEINGYKNNWTFTVNGTAPIGCSLIKLQPNDSIVWKFG
jgi:hypothetical protein